ncbi:MAG: serine protease Do [Pirellulaceae bacterium]|jgi:serine protease Do
MAKQFISVRLQSMNGVNLNQFQYEFDLTWMSFFQDAKGRTYTRYGGREDENSESHLTKASLLRVMRQVLFLHKENRVQPDNRYEPLATSLRTPEDIPPMKKMMSKRKESCIHCHDIKSATLRHHRETGTLAKSMIYTYPSPSRLGIHLDPNIQYKVREVADESAAEAAGILAGDLIRTLNDQRVLTFADATRVLELSPATGTLKVGLERDRQMVATTVQLPEGWRKNDDPSWRSTTGGVGPLSGIWGRRATTAQRQQEGLAADTLALKVTYIWAPWAKAAGIKHNDTIISVHGHKADMNIRQFQTHLHLNRNWGDKIIVTVRRANKEVDLTFQFPDSPPN